MLDIEEQHIIQNLDLKTYYQYSLFSNVDHYDSIDFFIFVQDVSGINYVELIIEYCSKNEPGEGDWAKVQIETFDTNQQVYVLNDYIIRKNFSTPLTFSIRSRSQGKIMRIGIKADQNGGIVSATSLRKKRT